MFKLGFDWNRIELSISGSRVVSLCQTFVICWNHWLSTRVINWKFVSILLSFLSTLILWLYLLFKECNRVHHIDLNSLKLFHLSFILFKRHIIARCRHEWGSAYWGWVPTSWLTSNLLQFLNVSFNVGRHIYTWNSNAFWNIEFFLFFSIELVQCLFLFFGSFLNHWVE